MIEFQIAVIAWFALIIYMAAKATHTIKKINIESRDRMKCIQKTCEQFASEKNHH